MNQKIIYILLLFLFVSITCFSQVNVGKNSQKVENDKVQNVELSAQPILIGNDFSHSAIEKSATKNDGNIEETSKKEVKIELKLTQQVEGNSLSNRIEKRIEVTKTTDSEKVERKTISKNMEIHPPSITNETKR